MRRRSGFSLVEVTISSVIVAVAIVGALESAGASLTMQRVTLQRATGGKLADELLDEILSRDFAEDQTTLGRDTDELTASRLSFDDVDDFDRYSETDPAGRDGQRIALVGSWTRSCSVVWLSLVDLSQTSTTPTNLKRIIVNVSCNGIPMATRTAVKANLDE